MDIDTGFPYLSQNFFTNQKKSKEFCSNLEAICFDENNCTKCFCTSDRYKFISYEYGCQNSSTAVKNLGCKYIFAYKRKSYLY